VATPLAFPLAALTVNAIPARTANATNSVIEILTIFDLYIFPYHHFQILCEESRVECFEWRHVCSHVNAEVKQSSSGFGGAARLRLQRCLCRCQRISRTMVYLVYVGPG
jgi:hypothetical protein